MQRYLSRATSSLSIPAYRWLFYSIVFGSMRLINVFAVRGWLVLTLTDSPFWVGAVVARRGSRSFVLSLGIKSMIHIGLMAFETAIMTMVLLITVEKMQGRVQGIYTLVFGFTWLRGLGMGSVASAGGAPLAIGLGGAVILVAPFVLKRPLLQLEINE